MENRNRASTDPKGCLGEKVQKREKKKTEIKTTNNKPNLWGNQPRKYSRMSTQEIRNKRGYTYSYKADYIKLESTENM